MKDIFIYLSGSVKKSHETNEFFWTTSHMEHMKKMFAKNGKNSVFLNPSFRSDDLSDEKSLFGRDLLQVYLSNCILVDGRERGVGVGYEMAVANFKRIPIFSWVPYGSHYWPKETILLEQKLTNWRHPFFQNPSVKLVQSLEEAADEISTYKFLEPAVLASNDFILPSIQHYIKTNLDKDLEMNSLVKSYDQLYKVDPKPG